MNCYHCGRVIADDTKFCPYCGKNNIDNGIANNVVYAKAPMQSPKSNTINVIIIAFVVVFAIIMIAGVSVYFIHKKYSSQEQKQVVMQTMEPHTATIEPAQRVFSRVPTYSTGYTYKNMSDIHTSVSATDNEAFMIENIIHEFDNAWIQYINNYDNTVFMFLREGTQAYKYAVKYGAKDISEEYLLIDVQDVRKSDNYYYAWVHEVINEYSDTTERKEYHWVYKIGYDNGGYYIVDYTSDPAYK